MFEREVKFIYDFNSNKVKNLGASATYTELLPLGIHPAILQYISAEIEYRIYEDRQTLLKHSMFDYSGSKITQHFKKITDEIKKEKRFSTDFICKVILHATSFNVNYLIRPNWSLKKLIFDTNESNNVAEILQILNYAYFYKHILKVIRNYLDKKKLITLDKEEFGELLTKFDKISIEAYGNDILESSINAMSSFFNIGSVKQNTVPLQGIAVFLQEKNLGDHLETIQRNIEGDIKGKIEINDLRSILFNIPMQKTEVLDFPKETKDKSVTFESEKDEEPEKETVAAEPEIEDEERTTVDEESDEGKNDVTDVEIKLRENKEKEIADVDKVEPTIDEEVDKTEEENETEAELTDELENEAEEVTEPETAEEEKKEVQSEDDELNEAAEYLVEQTDESPDIILAPEDEELEEEESEIERDEELESLEETEKNETSEEAEEEEVQIVDQTYEDDYSYPDPAKREEDSYELREDDFEESVDEEKVEETGVKEQTTDDNESKDEPDKIKDAVNSEVDSEDKIEKDEEVEDETPQTSLFGHIPNEELVDDEKPGDDFIEQYGSQNHVKRIDISDLLENKNMTRIIAVVFDYDMEEFANAVERICDSQNSQEAFGTLQEIFELNQVNPSSKEAQAFKDIISEFFEQE